MARVKTDYITDSLHCIETVMNETSIDVQLVHWRCCFSTASRFALERQQGFQIREQNRSNCTEDILMAREFIVRQMVPKGRIIRGRAAAFYTQFRHIIRLITGVQHVVNNDPDVGDFLNVFFLPN